jgi:urea transport system ATP-binding protein
MLFAEHLTVYYDESRILTDICLEVPSGQVVCLMGRNGAGKTTLLKTLMGMLKPRGHDSRSQSKVVFDGKDLTRHSPGEHARAGIGYVPQGRGIFPYLSVYENLLMGFEARQDKRPDRDAVEEMYVLFPVLKRMHRRTAGTLSGGQQQQLAIARSLVGRPRLLLLDEPTEGLQPSLVHEIERVIASLPGRDMSILLVEQFVDFAMAVADSYYVMETGAIVAHGPISQFDPAQVRAYLSV